MNWLKRKQPAAGKKCAQLTSRRGLGWWLTALAALQGIAAAQSDFGALSFDGVNDYVTMGAAPALGASTFTLECWIKIDGAGVAASSGNGGISVYPLIGKGRGEADGSNVDCNYLFGVRSDFRLAADFEDLNSGLNHPVVGSIVLTTGVWHHCAVSYDGDFWRLYVDGVADTVLQITGAVNVRTPRFDSIQHSSLGTAMNSTGTASGFFKGRIDEARIWNYARTPTQLTDNLDAQIAAATGLIARWSLNEASGTTAANTGSSTLSGTLVNGPAWAAGLLPSVTITSPANGAAVGTNFVVSASPRDVGAVTSVSFYDGATLLGSDSTSPYSFIWSNAPVGAHALTAVAAYSDGLSVTSATVSISTSSNLPPVVAPTAPADEATGLGSATTVSVSIADPEGDATTVTFFGRKTAPLVPGPDFTLMTLPDTQFYAQNTGGQRADTYYAQTQWIVDNRDTLRVAFVSHMGDIVQNGDFAGNPLEWLVADQAMGKIESQPATLRAHGIPWGGAPGNHDQSPIGDVTGTTTFYNQYFGSSRFAGRTYYGGHYGTTNNNNYQFFSASGLDFIILHLEYDTRPVASYQAVLDWADAVLKAFPARRAIVTSHWTVNTGNPATFSTQGQAIYDNLKDNPNLFLILGGHVSGEGQRSDVFAGRTVNSILQDYQGRVNGGDGWLRYFVFSPANNTITAKTYKVANTITPTSGYETDANSEFILTYPMQSAAMDWIAIGTVNVAAGGTQASLNWTGLEAGSRYEWYASVSDGISNVASATRRFSSTAPVSPTVALTSPSNGASYAPPGTINLTATANDPDGSVARVEFYADGTKLGEDSSAPFALNWTGAPSGTYVLTAVAVDNSGRTTLSSLVNVTVTGLGPTITLTSPAEGATASAPATISFAANASDSDGTVSKVEFYQGSYKVGEDTTAPYTYNWTNLAPGNYLLSAVAVDNAGNRSASVPVSNVISAVASSGTLVRGPYLQKAAPTQMTIRWRSSLSTVGRVRYGTSVMNLNQFIDEAAAPPTPSDHAITLPGLTAGTAYYYSVGSASDTLASGPDFTFTTPPTTGTPAATRVWVLGDAGTSGNSASPTLAQTAVRDAFYSWTGARTPDLVLQLGDNAYNSGTDGEFQKGVFDIYPTMLRKTPFWSCLGNHETAQATAYVDTYPYFDIYTLPTAGESGGVPSGTEHYYSFDYGNIHFICLDSMTADRSPTGAMAVWLQSDLASTTATWIICFFHHPPYTKGSHNSDTETELIQMRANLLPILETGGVDLVLTGHSHCYERSYLLDGHYGLSGTLTPVMKKNAGSGRPAGSGAYLKPLTGPRDHFGAVYAVAGSSGQATSWTGGSTAPVNPTPHPAMYVSLLQLGSLVLDVNGTRLDATFLRENSSTPDTFTMIKQGAADSDGDGIPDEYEIAHGLDRFSAADAALDSDGDGVSNLQEFVFSTASNVPDRYAFFTTYDRVSGTAAVTFPTAAGRSYRVLYSGDLLSWLPASAVIAGTGGTMLWTDDGTATGSLPSLAGKRFYRVQVTVLP